MATVEYRKPYFLSVKSKRYVEGLLENGWDPAYVDRLSTDLLRFESVSIRDSWEDARDILVHEHPDVHDEFFKSLNKHIKALTRAERYEALQEKARTKDKDSIAAIVIMSRGNGEVADLGALKSSRVRLDKLGAMSKEELDREVASVQKRIAIGVRDVSKP